jgi:hypothetical protein
MRGGFGEAGRKAKATGKSMSSQNFQWRLVTGLHCHFLMMQLLANHFERQGRFGEFKKRSKINPFFIK